MLTQRFKTWAARPVAVILTGSLVGQGAVLLVSPLLTRLYSVSDFGAFAAVTAVCAIAGAVITLSWDRAVVVPPDDVTARDLTCLGLVTTTVLSAVLAVVSWIYREQASELFGTAVFRDYWWITPLTVLFIGVFAVLSAGLVRDRMYRSIAVRNGVQGSAQAASSVALGVAGFTPLGLVSSLLVGRVVAVLGMSRRLSSAITRLRKPSGLVEAASRYRKFPLISTGSRLLNSSGLQLPVLLIIGLYGSVEAGLFALTVRVLASPVGIVADAVSQYFEGTLAHRARTGDLRLVALIRATLWRLSSVALIPAIIVILLGPQIFSWLFGEVWRDAGAVAQLMAIAYFAQFVVVPVSRTLQVLERQGLLLMWDAARMGLTLAAVAGPYALGWSFLATVGTLTVVQVLAYAVLGFACLRAARTREKESAIGPN